jgi:hypothetical protein
MPAVATQQVINNGPRNLVLKYTIDNAGGPIGDVTADTLVDISSLDSTIGVGGLRLDRCQWSLTGMAANLSWEGASDVDLLELADGDGEVDFTEIGGVANNASIPTGNVVYTTNGFGTAGDGGTIILEFKKKSPSSAIVALEAAPSTGSMTITGQAITLQEANPGTGSMTIAGQSITVSGFYNPITVGAPAAMTIASDIVVVTNEAP